MRPFNVYTVGVEVALVCPTFTLIDVCAFVPITLKTIVTNANIISTILYAGSVRIARWRTGRRNFGTVSPVALKTSNAPTDIGSFSIGTQSVCVTLVCFRICAFINI